MRLARTVFAVLLALSLAVTPIGSVYAASAGTAMMGMEDCDKMPKGDCPCCDPLTGCPPELCLIKCFKQLAIVSLPSVVDVLASLHLRPTEPDRQPDWSYGPQPPPPRT